MPDETGRYASAAGDGTGAGDVRNARSWASISARTVTGSAL
jgi:hypothetical protein